MSLSRIVADSIASNTVLATNISDNTVTSSKLTTTGVVANQYGNSTHISVIDVDAAGRITNATTSSIQTHLDTAYSNAVSVANTTSFNQAANAYANAVSDATNLAANAYANAVATANTTSYNQAANAYANVFNGGTFSGVTTFTANLTGNSVTLHGNLQIDGNLTVGGNTVTMNVSTLAVEDNMIYLNDGSAVAHPDLGIAGNYNDGTYRHAGVFRDATDGVWKFFHQYEPEPDASAYIDTANSTFKLANVQANTFIGNLSGDASTVGSNTASTLRTYSSDMAANAYSNATSYAATVAGTAYSNAVSYADTTFPTKSGSGATGTWGISVSGGVISSAANGAGVNLAYATVGSDDFARVRAGSDGYNSGWLELATADDGTEPIYVRQYSGVFSTVTRTLTLLDGSGNTSIPGSLSIGGSATIGGSTAIHAGNYTSYAWERSGAWKPSSLSSLTRQVGIGSPDGGEVAIAYGGGQSYVYCDGFFYQNEGAYRCIDTSGGTVASLTVSGSLSISQNNTTGGGLILADDGDFVDLNDGYGTMRFSLGLRIFSANRSGSAVITLNNGGNIYAAAYYYNSDQRLKTNIKGLNNSLSTIGKLKPVSFDWIKDNKSDIGFIAQDVKEHIEEAVSVSENDNETLTLNHNAILAHAVKAIQELTTKVEELEAKLSNLTVK